MKRATSLTPYDQSESGYLDFWELLEASGETAMHHDAIRWSSLTGHSFLQDHPYNEEFHDVARGRNLEHILVLDVTDITRTELTLPDGYEEYDFNDTTIRNAYIDEIMWLAGEATPEYFGLAMVWYFMYDQDVTGSLPAELGVFFSSHGLRWRTETGKPAWDTWIDFQGP